MKVYVPEFIPVNIKRRVFIVLAWVVYIISIGIVSVDLKDDKGFKYTTD